MIRSCPAQRAPASAPGFCTSGSATETGLVIDTLLGPASVVDEVGRPARSVSAACRLGQVPMVRQTPRRHVPVPSTRRGRIGCPSAGRRLSHPRAGAKRSQS